MNKYEHFEKQIAEIKKKYNAGLGEAADVLSELYNSTKHMTTEQMNKAFDGLGEVDLSMLDELKPPRPTCLSCKHLDVDKDEYVTKHYCTKIVKHVGSNINGRIHTIDKPKSFGCIHHSDFERVKHDNS